MASLIDLSGNGHGLTLVEGTYTPLVLRPGTLGQTLFSPGFDDIWFDAPVDPPVDGIDFRWWGDITEVIEINPATVNVVLHQGSEASNDFAWAVRWNKTSGVVGVVWSEDGTAGNEILGGAVAGDSRSAVWFDPADGSLTVYTQPLGAPVGDYDQPLDSDAWTVVSVTAGSGVTSIFPTTDSVRQCSQIDTVPVTPNSPQGWGNFYRLTLRNGFDGPLLCDMDSLTIPQPLTPWVLVGGYPSVGGVTDANEASFAGGAGESWTIHNFNTSSVGITIVNRPLLYVGHDALSQVSTSDDSNGSGAGSFTWAIAFRTYRPTTSGNNALYFTSPAGPGWATAHIYAAVTDGTDNAIAHADDYPTAGEVQVYVFVVDRPNNDLLFYINGILNDTADITAVGSIATAQPLVVGGQTAIDVFAAACWDGRVLDETEIGVVTTSWANGGLFNAEDDYITSIDLEPGS